MDIFLEKHFFQLIFFFLPISQPTSNTNKDDQNSNPEISISIEDTEHTGPDIKLDR